MKTIYIIALSLILFGCSNDNYVSEPHGTNLSGVIACEAYYEYTGTDDLHREGSEDAGYDIDDSAILKGCITEHNTFSNDSYVSIQDYFKKYSPSKNNTILSIGLSGDRRIIYIYYKLYN